MLTVTAIPAFADNYLWLLESEQQCWVVDPGDADRVRTVLRQRGRTLDGILVTHHHPDHIGGISELMSPNMPIIGPRKSRFKHVNDPVGDGDIRSICGLDFQVLEVPGHTLNHVAYFAQPEKSEPRSTQPILFCGDTLFAGGCGRLREGSAEQMHRSLQRLSQLPPDTQVYCAHEYTLANFEFALSVDPGNKKLIKRHRESLNLRRAGLATIPTSIQAELETNPFLRVSSHAIVASALKSDKNSGVEPAEIFATIRHMKDRF